MAFQPLRSLFSRSSVTWDAADVRQYAQDYLRAQVQADAVYCDDVSDGVVAVRVGTAAAAQAVQLVEYDLAVALKEQADFELVKLHVRVV